MKARIASRDVRFGVDRLSTVEDVPRHRHLKAYATVVLAGAFEQYSFAGRLKLEAGDVLVNPTLDCHANRMLSRGLTLIRLPWHLEASFGGVYRNLAVDAIARARGTAEAAGLLAEQIVGKSYASFAARDWPDKLAHDLQKNPRLRVSKWAESQGLSREYAWRCFARTFGVAPAQFRSEMNARGALLTLARSNDPLSRIAADFGFADQSHMSRAIKTLCGISPAQWRDVNRSKIAGATGIPLQGIGLIEADSR